jgi:phosphoribosylformimino-5-aminoimidazole carboxamide ribonucleotide (ProFAR) isomerase
MNGKTIFIDYTDDAILTGPNNGVIDKLVKKIGNIFKIEDQGGLSDILEMKVVKHENGSMGWTQP